MEMRHLRYFVAVALEQNVTRAAAKLHVSQPPLSRQIRDLEGELGVELFHRTGKSVRLTDAGRVFLEEARAVLRRAEEAVNTVRAVAAGERGELHVGYAPSLTVELLPRALRGFEAAAPGVRVVLHDLSTGELLAGLREHRLHVALMIHPGARQIAGLAFRELRRFRVCVASAAGHPLSAVRAPALRRIFQERLIAYTRTDYPEYHEWLAALAASCGTAQSIGEEHDSSTSLIAAVEAGRGVALVPESFSCFAGMRLNVRPVAPAPPPFIAGACHLRSARSAMAARFIAAAAKA